MLVRIGYLHNDGSILIMETGRVTGAGGPNLPNEASVRMKNRRIARTLFTEDSAS
jgi:hypothetical protein